MVCTCTYTLVLGQWHRRCVSHFPSIFVFHHHLHGSNIPQHWLPITLQGHPSNHHSNKDMNHHQDTVYKSRQVGANCCTLFRGTTTMSCPLLRGTITMSCPLLRGTITMSCPLLRGTITMSCPLLRGTITMSCPLLRSTITMVLSSLAKKILTRSYSL